MPNRRIDTDRFAAGHAEAMSRSVLNGEAK
jgi:hypothetical protein